jgi:AraC family transcriptional regulator of adaptative response/methylated-DNA-[protein]-cysteine methyltransferase
MSTSTAPTFKYNFRAPGSKVEGPIRYAVGQSVVGKVLIGRSKKGVCAIFLGSEATALRSLLASEFPGVELQSAQAALRAELGQVTAFIDKGYGRGHCEPRHRRHAVRAACVASALWYPGRRDAQL